MASTQSKSVAAQIQLFTRIINGINLHVTSSILLGGQSISPTQLVAVFQAAIQAESDLVLAKTAYQQKLAAQQAAFTTAHTTASMLKSYVYGAYGKTNPLVTDFGFSVLKAVVKSVKVKAVAALKSVATRVARGTKGSKQKASIHGVLSTPEETSVVPATTPVVTK